MNDQLPPPESTLPEIIQAADLEPNAAWRAVRDGRKVRPTGRLGSAKLYDRPHQLELVSVLEQYAARCERTAELTRLQQLRVRLAEAWDRERLEQIAHREARRVLAEHAEDRLKWLVGRVAVRLLPYDAELGREGAERAARMGLSVAIKEIASWRP